MWWDPSRDGGHLAWELAFPILKYSRTQRCLWIRGQKVLFFQIASVTPGSLVEKGPLQGPVGCSQLRVNVGTWVCVSLHVCVIILITIPKQTLPFQVRACLRVEGLWKARLSRDFGCRSNLPDCSLYLLIRVSRENTSHLSSFSNESTPHLLV